MKHRSIAIQEDADTNALAQEIFSVVRLFPPKLKLEDVSDVFYRIGKGLEKSSVGETDRPDGNWNQKATDEDIAAFKEHEAIIFATRTITAIDALLECCKGLPAAITDRLDLVPLDSERIYKLLRLNTWMDESFEAFQDHGKRDKEWLKAATQYAVVLDACGRYTKMRSWYDRLYYLGFLGGPIIKHVADKLAKLLPANKLFVFGALSVRDGRISAEPDEFTKAFYNVEIERIRLCGACKKVFWATRTDMKGCTVKCAKVIRTRKWRAKPGNRLKEQYRDYKKDLKEKK